jgi:hypothetical protein
MKFFGQRYPWLTSVLLAGLAHRSLSNAHAEEPRWFKLNGIPEASVGLEVESSTETTRVSGSESTYDHLFVTPTVGLRTSGSIYHPNLLAFDLDGEMGWGWDNMTVKSPGSCSTRNESQELNRYLAQLNFLEEKPYNASFFAAQDHTHRDYGTFDTFTVDSERYGGRVNWNTEHLSLNTDFGYRDETSTGLNDSSEITEMYFNFSGINQRKSGQTTLTFRINQFDNTFNFGNTFRSLNQVVGLSDAETLGVRKNINVATGVSFGQSEYGGQTTDTITANENVNITHRPNLDSYAVLDFAYNKLKSITDTRVQGTVGVRHQLFDSLGSTADVHGSHQENSGFTSTSTTDRVGLGLFESYNKRLQSWGRLTVGAGAVLDHEQDQSTGSIISSIDEPHQLYLPTSASYTPIYLNRPRVVAGSVQVSVLGDVLIEGSDYQLIMSGELTEVQLLVPPSSHLNSLLLGSDNLAVTVTYASDSLNNASYESLNANFSVRLELYDNLGLYGRVNWMDNDAPSGVLVQTLTDLVAGVDYHWRWFRLGAEFENYDSNFSQYQAERFYQTADFRLDPRSSLGVSFNETFYTYADGRDQTQYQFLTRYSTRLWASLNWYVEGGCSLQEVLGTEQVQGSARTGVNWTRGKLSLRAGYEFNVQSTDSGLWTEEREKHRLFVYLKRTF